MTAVTDRLEVWGVEGLPEVQDGDDVAALIAGVDGLDLRDGDVLVVTSKVVSKAQGRLVTGNREDHLRAQTRRVVARRGETHIVETHHGFVMAAAGIDASNVPAGMVALLPRDPDAAAREIRAGLGDRLGVDVGVVVSDTMGRPWRNGVTDVAIGAAGLDVLWDLRGETDPAGHRLEATVVAVADELAATGDLVKGKLAATPVAVVRGFPLRRNGTEAGAQDAGARPLVRSAADDMFRLGTREARAELVERALTTEAPQDATVPAADPQALATAVARAAVEGVDLRPSVDATTVTASGEPFAVGLAVGRLAVALAGSDLRCIGIERITETEALVHVAGLEAAP